MEDKVLFPNTCPLLEEGEQKLLNDCFREELQKSDQIEIAVGFCSHRSLKELDALIWKQKIKKVCVNLGMYYFHGLSESLHELALEINER